MDESTKVNDMPKCPFLEDQGINNLISSSNSDKENLKTDIEQGNTIHARPNNTNENEGIVPVSDKKCLFVNLKPSASYLNLISFYLVQFSYVCFFTFMDSMQPHLLEKDQGYIEWGEDYTKEKANLISSDLIFYENLYLVSITIILFYIDRFYCLLWVIS